MRICEYEYVVNTDTQLIEPILKKRTNYPKLSKGFRNAVDIVNTMNDIFNLDHLADENVYLIMTRESKIVGVHQLAKGGLNESYVPIPELFYKVLLLGCKDFILCHNHPSGSNLPSKQDLLVTDRVRQSCEILGMNLIDHIIVSKSGYWSYHDSIQSSI